VNPLLLPVFLMARANQPRIAFTFNQYAPLNLANVANPLNALPAGNYGKYMPKFVGNNAITAESHIKDFLEYLENIGVTEEDVVMRLFAQILTSDARYWYKALAVNSIDGWNTFHDRFMDKWSHKKDTAFLLKSFSLIKKNENKSMEEFNSRFMKAYYKIPQTVRPNPASALIFYIEQFDGLFSVFLKQKEPHDLESAFKEALKMEKHFVTANQAKVSLQELLDPQGQKVSQTPSPPLVQPLLELKKEPKKEEDDLCSNPQVVSLLQDLVQKLNVQDKPSHPSASSQRTFN
jgi:hypothetical protein